MRSVGRVLARILTKPRAHFMSAVSGAAETNWMNWIEPADVLLIEGNTRVSSVIKYLTQSTWSHACLVAGERCPQGPLIEAELEAGVVASPYQKYRDLNVRICRPLGLTARERHQVIDSAIAELGKQYDLRNLFDLARYFLPLPVPPHKRRQSLTFGSGEPTRAICSGMIAEAFQSVGYPILPLAWPESGDRQQREIVYQVAQHSSFTPRDFDLSPYFEIVKPMIAQQFDFHRMRWHRPVKDPEAGDALSS